MVEIRCQLPGKVVDQSPVKLRPVWLETTAIAPILLGASERAVNARMGRVTRGVLSDITGPLTLRLWTVRHPIISLGTTHDLLIGIIAAVSSGIPFARGIVWERIPSLFSNVMKMVWF